MANKIEKQFLDTENKGPVRLNKYLSEAGVCSRREADKLIAAGQVTVDGVRAETGMKVEPWQVVRIGKKQVSRQEEMIVLAVNKPRGIVCTEERRERDSIVRFLNYPVRITYVLPHHVTPCRLRLFHHFGVFIQDQPSQSGLLSNFLHRMFIKKYLHFA